MRHNIYQPKQPMTLLDNLRARPEEERFAAAAMIAGGVALILFLAWGAFFFNSARGGEAVAPASSEDQAAAALKSAQEIKEALGAAADQYAQIRTVIEGAQFSDVEPDDTVTTISVSKSGEVEVGSAIVGPTLPHETENQ